MGGYFPTSTVGPDGVRVDKPKQDLQAAKDEVLLRQAREGKMPGAMMLKVLLVIGGPRGARAAGGAVAQQQEQGWGGGGGGGA